MLRQKNSFNIVSVSVKDRISVNIVTSKKSPDQRVVRGGSIKEGGLG